MWQWFQPKNIPTFLNHEETMWKTTMPITNFGLDKFVVVATTDGALKLDVNGGFQVTIPNELRHDFLRKIQKAVEMADIADPDNKK